MTYPRVAVLALLLIIGLPITSLADSVKGIYSLMERMCSVNPSVLKLPFLTGVSVRASWEALEPQEGKIDWSYLDNALKDVKKAKKKAMLRVVPGVLSPAWIYKKGVAFREIKDVNKYHKTYGQMRKLPLPWDEIYLQEWIKFVHAFGKRYNSDDAVVMVHMAGPATTAEMHLPKKTNRKIIEEAGYSKERLVNAWRKVIDAYNEAFPQKPLALNIAVPLKNDGAMEQIIQYAISKIGKRFCIQGNWLSAHTNESSHLYGAVRELRKRYDVIVGFQMLDSAVQRPERQGSLETSVQKGLAAGAKYFEIYQADLKVQKNGAFFEELDKKLR